MEVLLTAEVKNWERNRTQERLPVEPQHLDCEFEAWDIVEITDVIAKAYPDYDKFIGRIGILQSTKYVDYPDVVCIEAGEALPTAYLELKLVRKLTGRPSEIARKGNLLRRIAKDLGGNFTSLEEYYPV